MRKAIGCFVLLLMLAGCAVQKPAGPNISPTPSGRKFLISAFDAPGPNDKDWALIAPHIQGQVLVVPWSSVETSPSQYSFAATDQRVAEIRRLGLQPDLILELVTEGVIVGKPNTATPAWIVRQVDVSKCGIPLVWESAFADAAYNFVRAVLQHYQSGVVMLRAGGVEGGEVTLVCLINSPKWDQKAFLDYIGKFDGTLAGNRNGLRVVAPASDKVGGQEAALAHGAGIGMGNSSLTKKHESYEKSLFGKYPNDTIYFQTGGISDASGAGGVGTLDQIVPFAVDVLHARVLEIYWSDLRTAWVPGAPGYAQYGTAYREVLQSGQ